MGIVYRALDSVIGRTVAIKTLHTAELGGDPAEQELSKERLFREAQSAGILSHPGIVTIYQAGQDGDVLFIAMEYIDGPNLAAAMNRTKPSLELTLQLLKQAAEALDYAHSKGVVHRDIKPANLLLQSEGRLKIADFGIAKLAASTLTKTGTTVGSPAYMSPEQVRAVALDGRADQYSLAILAYEMMTGSRPFDSDTITSLVFKIVFEEPDLSLLGTAVPRGDRLEPVLKKALAKKAEDRYPNCVAFWQALSDAAAAVPVPAPVPDRTLSFGVSTPVQPQVPLTAPSLAPPPDRRKLLAGIGVFAVAIAGGGVLTWIKREPLPQVQNPAKPTGGNSPPELITRVEAPYRPAKAGTEGTVTLGIVINEQGLAEDAVVVRSVDPGLDRSALETVKQWRFKPAMMNGEPVAAKRQVEFTFVIPK